MVYRKRTIRAVKRRPLGFSNERFLELLSTLTGITPVGELGRETPLDFTSLEAARGTLLIREVFSKYDDGKPSENKEATTWKRFQEAEAMCQRTNQRYYEIAHKDPFWVCVRRRLWDALGKFDWDEAAKHFAHGPGSTTRYPKASAFKAYKYSGKPESTSGNAVLAACAIKHVPLWIQSVHSEVDSMSSSPQVTEELGEGGQIPLFSDDNLRECSKLLHEREGHWPGKLDPTMWRLFPYKPVDLYALWNEPSTWVTIVEGNSVIAVPKNYKTNRTIAKEPCMNIYVQKGIGRCIRERLYRVGVNLDDQTRNQRAACEGSITGALATVDLSMASDTLSYEVVRWLLPNDWWYALEQCRSPVGVLPSGTKIKYQKFSSMGNGYTFELESLIFWAICQQVCRPNINERDLSVCVYGDDLIIPTEHYGELVERLRQAGFEPNPSKSFASGPYRESCGKHYFNGSDITPFYVRRPVQSLDRLFLTHNNVYRWSDRAGVEAQELCASLRKLAPSAWRDPRLPDGYGDGAFIGSVDELRMDSHPHGWEYWQVTALVQTSIALEGDLPFGQLLASLYATGARQSIVPNRVLEKARRLSKQRAKRLSEGYARLELGWLDETVSGLPVKEGQYQTQTILVPRHPQR